MEVGSRTAGQGVASQRIHNLPFPRNRFFTGRNDVLERLHTSLNDGERVQALNGMGGIGKTQTALEYAYRYREDYRVVLWANANSRETLVPDFTAIAGLLNLPEKDVQDQNEAVAAVERWLADNTAWLLILDNADEIGITEEFIPSGETGHVLLTTRAHAMGAVGEGNPIEKMTPQEGALFLLRRLRKVKRDEALEVATPELRAQAEALSAMVDGLPLALDQAAAFIEEKPSTLEEYQTFYQSERQKLLERRGKLAKDHPSVTVTFLLAFKKVEEANPAAADLLRVCAFLEADNIPEEIFREGAGELGETISRVGENALGLSDVIEEAARFSLLRRNPEAETVSLHRLVQAVLRDEMNEDTKRTWAERAIRALNKAFPDVEYSNWPSCNRLIPHAQSLALLIDEYGFEFPEASGLLCLAGNCLYARGLYGEAEPFYVQMLALKEKALGFEHAEVANCLNSLAKLYYGQWRYEEAESLLKRALAIAEKTLGAEHPDVAEGLNTLALIDERQGKYEEAESLLKRALVIAEKTLGPEHPSVAQCFNNLALLLYNQEKYEEAEPLFKCALAMLEATLGPERPEVANISFNLASVYDKQRKYAEAEPFYKRALAIAEETLGPEHPQLGHYLYYFAEFYDSQGKYAKAEPLYKRSLNIREKALGTEHSEFVRSLNILALIYVKYGKYEEAESLLERALALREKVLGGEHPATAQSLNDLAALYQLHGRYEKAELLYERALAIFEKALGVKHPNFVMGLRNYASILRAMGKDSEAEKLEARAALRPK